MKKLTILLALKDRDIYTKKWLDHNLFPEFSYFIADGSVSDNNRKICEKYLKDNVTYVRYQPDSTYSIYIKKRLDALKKIKTRYVLFADNDDFLLRHGLNKIIEKFTLNPEINLIQGKVGKVTVNNAGLYNRSKDWTISFYINKNPFINIKKVASVDFDYSLFYSVSETRIQRNIFRIFDQSGVKNPYIVERFQTYFSLALAKIEHVPYYYYVRLDNPVSSMHQFFSKKYRFDLCINEDFNDSFLYLTRKLLSQLPGVNYSLLFNLLRDKEISKIDVKIRDQVYLFLRFKFFCIFNFISSFFYIKKRVYLNNIASLFKNL